VRSFYVYRYIFTTAAFITGERKKENGGLRNEGVSPQGGSKMRRGCLRVARGRAGGEERRSEDRVQGADEEISRCPEKNANAHTENTTECSHEPSLVTDLPTSSRPFEMLSAKQSVQSIKAQRPRLASRAGVKVQAASDLWFPSAARPAYLKGTLAGDRGFDPLGLGADPVALKW